MSHPRRTGLLLFGACVALALAGQYHFLYVRDRFWDGVFFYGAALLCFSLLLTLPLGPARSRREPLLPRTWREVPGWPGWRLPGKTLRQHPLRAWGLLVALLCTWAAIRLNQEGNNIGAVLLWLAAIGFSLLAWLGLRQEPAGPRELARSPADSPAVAPAAGTGRVGLRWRAWQWTLAHREGLAMAGCTLLALLLRLPNLGSIPYLISGDEGSMGLEALHVLEGSLRNPFATGWLSHPTLYFFMLAGSIAILGRNAWGLRIFSPLAGAAAVPVLYLLARRLFDRRVAFAAAVLLAASHLSIHFSRLGLNNIQDPLWGLLVFLFLVRGLQEGWVVDFALSGFFLGLAQFFYMGARLLPIMVAVFLVLWWLLYPAARRRLWLGGAALGSAFLAAGGPLFYFFALHPEDFLARLRIVGIVQSGWLFQSEPIVTGKTPLQLLGDQLRKSILAFNYTLDPTSWYKAPLPYLDFLSAICFALGLVVLLRRFRSQGHLVVHVWFWLCLLFGGVLIENPPSSPRFVLFMPAVCLIAALGLAGLLEVLARLTGLPRGWKTALLGALLLLAVGLNTYFYFGEYTPTHVFGGLNTEVGTRLGEYLSRQEAGSKVFFFGPPRMWVGYATIPFLAPGMETYDIEQPLKAPPELGPLPGAFFIFLPERVSELEYVRQSYPEGVLEEVAGHSGEALFVVYQVQGTGPAIPAP